MSKLEINLEKPRLSKGEARLLDVVLSESRYGYLEFGMGGSTLKAVRSETPKLVGGDSDARWVKAVSEHPEIAHGCASGRVKLVHASIGPVGAWGRPADKSRIDLWPNYISKPWSECRNNGFYPDVIFIDGRFRMACAISAVIIGLADPEWSTKVRVILHDYIGREKKYEAIHHFYDIIKQEDTMLIMAIKKAPDPILALAGLMQHITNSG